jgi:hypothetical protein
MALSFLRDRVNPGAIYGSIDDFAQKFGSVALHEIAKLAKRLASRSKNTRVGERFVVEFLSSKLATARSVAVERYQAIIIKGGQKVRRYYDLVIDNIFFELKNWDPKAWPTFPPSGKNRAWDTARTQWLRDMRFHGVNAPTQLRWVFPKEFLAKFPKSVIAKEFAALLNSSRFKAYCKDVNNPRLRQDILEAFGATFHPSGRLKTGVKTVLVEQLLVSQP